MSLGEPVVIETRSVRKEYDGAVAVRDMNLRIPKGQIVALVGPNGAGKTTTLRMLAALMEPTEGTVLICGADTRSDPRGARSHLGFLPDVFGLYDDLKCWEYLDYFADVYRVQSRETAVTEALATVGLEEKRDAAIGTLSHGMRQRLAIARCLIHDPEVLLLDEPASGLDPIARIELRKLLKALRERGKTILVSSHILSELSDFCTSVALMEKGRLIEQGTISEVLERAGQKSVVVVRVTAGVEKAKEVLGAFEGVTGLDAKDASTIEVAYSGSRERLPEMLRKLVQAEGVEVLGFGERSGDIEDIFMKLSSGETS
jgi:ABC-2 type transport system ATP-binding protein